MNKLHYLRFDTNSEEIVPIVFTDGSTLQKMNDKWIENSDKHVYVYNEIKIHDNEIHLEDKTRSVIAKLDEQCNFWISYPGAKWFIFKRVYINNKVDIDDNVKPEIISHNSKIALINLGTPNMENMLKETRRNHKEYCNKHNYDYICYNDSIIPFDVVTWNKIYVLQKHINDYEWIVWIDCDAVFTNKNIKLESIIDKSHNNSLLVCDDIGGWRFNSGVMFWKNNVWSKLILHELTQMEHIGHSKGAEQQQLINLLHNKSGYKIFPRKCFNQHPDEHNENDFILHMM